MIGTALKNTILFLLIILLLNALLGNVIADKLKNNLKNGNDVENNFNQNNTVNEDDLEVKDIEYALPERDVANNTNKMKQIYDFVFDDNADDSLDKFYKVEDEKEIKNKYKRY